MYEDTDFQGLVTDKKLCEVICEYGFCSILANSYLLVTVGVFFISQGSLVSREASFKEKVSAN